MATRGINQCQKLTLFYCEHGGSSQAVRDFLRSGKLVQWATERPSVQIKVKVRNGKHPFVKADYLSGVSNERKPHAHQICLRSNQAKAPEVGDIFDQLYNRSGRKITKLTKPVYSQTPSVQGVWTPSLNLHLTPKFPMYFKDA
jgi:large subunit ribosomal protein L43